MSASRKPKRFRDTSGFTLVEVLVAFAVMATLLSVLFRGVVGMRAGSVAFDDHTHMELVARTILDDAVAERDLRSGTTTGQREGLRWSLVAKPVDLAEQMPAPAEDAKNEAPAVPTGKPEVKWLPQRLRVQVEGRGRPLEIETIRLVKAE